jgi:hypothetical protein
MEGIASREFEPQLYSKDNRKGRGRRERRERRQEQGQ